MQEVVDAMVERAKVHSPDVIVGIESRGFLFGVPLAMALGVPFSMARKLGKLPYDRITEEYDLEYGTNTIEMHTDAINPGQRAYVVDDLLATGGTAAAASRLIQRLHGTTVGYGFMVDLTFLGGRHKLGDTPIDALISF